MKNKKKTMYLPRPMHTRGVPAVGIGTYFNIYL